MGLHRSSEDDGGLSTLFTENVRLSRVIFIRIDCHIFTNFFYFLGKHWYFETIVGLLRRPLDN